MSRTALVAVDFDRLVSAYMAAWNSLDAAARERHLLATWGDAARFCDPLAEFVGREAMGNYIASFRACRPGSRFMVQGDVAHHHDQFRFAWHLIDSSGREVLRGMSFGELDAQRRIRRLAAFYGDAAAEPCSTLATELIAKARGMRSGQRRSNG